MRAAVGQNRAFSLRGLPAGRLDSGVAPVVSDAGPAQHSWLRWLAPAIPIVSAFLLATVVGSGIMGERLAAGNAAVALLANTLATGAALVALILTFGPISGAHFNPAVTLADASQGGLPWRDVPGYVAVQIGGAFAGVAAAHIMFELPPFFASRHASSKRIVRTKLRTNRSSKRPRLA